MSDFNTTITKEEVLKLLDDLNATIVSKEEITITIKDTFLSNFDGINTMIGNSLMMLFGTATAITIFLGLKTLQRKKIIDEAVFIINKEVQHELKSIEEESTIKFNKKIRNFLKKHKHESLNDEYQRNLIFYDLSKMLASDIHANGENNLKEVFNSHSIRLFLVTQLTSGKEEETNNALRSLSTKKHDRILKLDSLKMYLKTLENRYDIDVEEKLEQLNKIISKQKG